MIAVAHWTFVGLYGALVDYQCAESWLRSDCGADLVRKNRCSCRIQRILYCICTSRCPRRGLTGAPAKVGCIEEPKIDLAFCQLRESVRKRYTYTCITLGYGVTVGAALDEILASRHYSHVLWFVCALPVHSKSTTLSYSVISEHLGRKH